MDPQKQAHDVKPPKPATAEPSIRTDGTRLFRLINFELFARPTPRMRMMSVAGSGLFVGVMCYFTFFMEGPQKQQQQQQQPQRRL